MKRSRAVGVALATLGLLATGSAVPAAFAAPQSFNPIKVDTNRSVAASASHTTDVALPTAVADEVAPVIELTSWQNGCVTDVTTEAGIWLTYRNNGTVAKDVVVAITHFDARPTEEDFERLTLQPGEEDTFGTWAVNGAAYRLWEMSNAGDEWDYMSSLPDCAKGDPFADSNYFGDHFGMEIDWMFQSGLSKGWPEANGTRTYRGLTSMNRDAIAAFLFHYTNHTALGPNA